MCSTLDGAVHHARAVNEMSDFVPNARLFAEFCRFSTLVKVEGCEHIRAA
jgi:hypothetical protein